MKTVLKLAIVMTLLVQEAQVKSQVKITLDSEHYPSIPDKIGFAAMYAAEVKGGILAAGGANFPDKMPWEGGVKRWHNTIYSLEKKGKVWKELSLKLPIEMAYGISASLKEGLLVCGGNTTDNKPLSSTLRIIHKNGTYVCEQLRDMPFTLANMSGAKMGNWMFVATGSKTQDGTPSNVFLAYDIKRDIWINLPDVPGPARINAVSAVFDGRFYIFSGIAIEKEGAVTKRIILSDAYCFEPRVKEGRLAGGVWRQLSSSPIGVAAGPVQAPVNRKGEVVFLGGLDHNTAQHADPKTHPGFLNDVYVYKIATDSWKKVGVLPKKEMRLTLPVVQIGKKAVLINGEIGPGVRTNTNLAVDIEKL